MKRSKKSLLIPRLLRPHIQADGSQLPELWKELSYVYQRMPEMLFSLVQS